MKTTLLDDTLLFNLTVFYNPYSNAQIPSPGIRRPTTVRRRISPPS